MAQMGSAGRNRAGRRFGLLVSQICHISLDPPDPAPHVQSKPGGGASLPRLLLIKPDGTGDEFLYGAQEIEAFFDPPDEDLVRVVNFRF